MGMSDIRVMRAMCVIQMLCERRSCRRENKNASKNNLGKKFGFWLVGGLKFNLRTHMKCVYLRPLLRRAQKSAFQPPNPVWRSPQSHNERTQQAKTNSDENRQKDIDYNRSALRENDISDIEPYYKKH